MVERKPVLLRGDLHRRLRLVCFNYDVHLQTLADSIVEFVLSDELVLHRIVEKIKG